MNSAYKHLEAKLRVGELTVGQWAALVLGALTALVWGMYVSPFGTQLTLFTACYIGGFPAGAIILATMSDVDVGLIVRAALRWRREEGRHVAGPGTSGQGYVVKPEPVDERKQSTGEELADLDLAALWES